MTAPVQALFSLKPTTVLFDAQEQPKKVAVIGAGYIAVELAGVFQSLGTDTTLLVRRDRPLRPFDSYIVEVLISEMDKSGLTLKPHSVPKVSKCLEAHASCPFKAYHT